LDSAVLDQIKSSVDLVQLVENYGVKLKRSGAQFQGLCPFHGDRATPSFFVNRQKQMYRCHGCQAGGDSIKFVQAIEQVQFVEAVKILATMGGVAIAALTEDDKKAWREKKRALDAEKKAFDDWLGELRWKLRAKEEQLIALELLSRRWLAANRYPASTYDEQREELAWEIQFDVLPKTTDIRKALDVLRDSQPSMLLDLFRNQRAWLRGTKSEKMTRTLDQLAYESPDTAYFADVERGCADFWQAARIIRDGVEAL
jgi:hypothetical protein